MTTVNLPCLRCGVPVEIVLEYRLAGAERGAICSDCIASDGRSQIDRGLAEQRTAGWRDTCPRQFADTEIKRLPCPAQSAAAMRWKPDSGAGLNLWGMPATGKSRTLFLLLKRAYVAGASVRFFLSGQFEGELEKRAWKRAAWLDRVCLCDVLAFDDLDKCAPLSGDHEKVLFSILDRRMANAKPVLLTHNSTAAQLEYNFRHGEAMVRRIRDFTRSVYFKRV